MIDQVRMSEDVDRFLRQEYLHWLEAFGIMGSVPKGITAMLILLEQMAN